MSEESRADRLRERRKSSSERTTSTDETAESDNSDELDKQSKPAKRSQPDKPSEKNESVKVQQEGTYMYLPEWQKRELDRLYSILKADYEYEFKQSFQKNRHFYPVVIQMGLEELSDADASDVQDRLRDLREESG